MAEYSDLPQEYTDEAVAEFLRERHERILIRRARIGSRLLKRNETGKLDGSETSSLDFAADEGKAGPTPSSAGSTGGGALGRKAGGPSRGAKDGKDADGGTIMDGGAGGAAGGGAGGGAAGGGAAGGGAGAEGGGGAEILDLKRSTGDPLDVQIEESRKQLEQIILDGEALVTNVRVAAECREKLRHVKQEENRKDRMERLQKESDECQEMYEALKPNWDLSGEKALPIDLFEKIKTQMQASEELLMRKQDLISSMQQEIEDNDFEYEQNLEMYQKDTNLIGDRIDDCVDDMQGSFLNELNLIEDYTCRNREVFLEENQREWMDLLGDFEKMEESHLESRKDDALNKFKDLNELYIQIKQECRAMRHKFEDDLRILVQELEQIKYATQLNMEKLQYNLAIVRKRYKENVEMKNMMKRLLLKFNDRFTTKSRALKTKMEAGKKEAKKILGDIAKLEESLSQFGRKTLHLAMSDWGKYMDLWMVSEEMVRERVKKLLDSEKFIFETQLGFSNAIIPEMTFMDDRPEQVTKYVVKKSDTYAELLQQNQRPSTSTSEAEKKKSRATSEDIKDDDSLKETTEKEDSCQQSASLLLLPSDSTEFIPGPEPDPALQRRLMRHVAKVICNESGFLVEEELRKLLEPLVETERNLVNLDALLKALGINSIGEMQYLAHFMLRRCRVMKGIISRIASKESAHLSEMNVSLEGIVGKNAMDDLDSEGSTTTKSVSPVQASDGVHGNTDESSGSTPFQECDCNVLEAKRVDALAKRDKEGKGKAPAKATQAEPKMLGETSVDILLPPTSHGGSPDEDDEDDDNDDQGATCSLMQELKNIDDQQLSFGNFTQDPGHCTPKCCSIFGSETTCEEAVVEVVDDDDLEEMLDEAAEEEDDEEEDEDANNLGQRPSVCSTCGGEPHDHQDCSFFSSDATVMSWVEPEDYPNKALKEALQRVAAEEAKPQEEDIIPLSSLPAQLLESEGEEEGSPGESREATGSPPPPTQPSLTPVTPGNTETEEKRPRNIGEDGTLKVLGWESAPAPALEDYGEPVRRYSEVVAAPIVSAGAATGETAGTGDKSTALSGSGDSSTPFRTESGDNESQETESLESMDSSSNGSAEFMYIEPDEVIEALTEFCKDYNARITVELPTLDDLIDRKLNNTFKYPRQQTVLEYWERPVRILNSNSDELWDTIQYCFEQFHDALTKRNRMVDKFITLYKQNQELGVLMKNHFNAARRYSSSAPNRNSGFMHYGRFCNN